MLKKTTWIVLLLIALLAISATVAWAGGLNRAVQASLLPSGNAAVSKLDGVGSAQQKVTSSKSDRQGHCHMSDAVASEPAW